MKISLVRLAGGLMINNFDRIWMYRAFVTIHFRYEIDTSKDESNHTRPVEISTGVILRCSVSGSHRVGK